MRYGLNEKTISQINSVFVSYPNVTEVKIYGSRAKGNYKNGSDIDLCIYADNLSSDELIRIKNEIDDLFIIYAVDITDYKTIENIDLKEHIDRVGQSFYDSLPS